MDNTNEDDFSDFSKISEHFRSLSKIVRRSSECHTNVSDHFRKCPKISEDFNIQTGKDMEATCVPDLVTVHSKTFKRGKSAMEPT